MTVLVAQGKRVDEERWGECVGERRSCVMREKTGGLYTSGEGEAEREREEGYSYKSKGVRREQMVVVGEGHRGCHPSLALRLKGLGRRRSLRGPASRGQHPARRCRPRQAAAGILRRSCQMRHHQGILAAAAAAALRTLRMPVPSAVAGGRRTRRTETGSLRPLLLLLQQQLPREGRGSTAQPLQQRQQRQPLQPLLAAGRG